MPERSGCLCPENIVIVSSRGVTTWLLSAYPLQSEAKLPTCTRLACSARSSLKRLNANGLPRNEYSHLNGAPSALRKSSSVNPSMTTIASSLLGIFRSSPSVSVSFLTPNSPPFLCIL